MFQSTLPRKERRYVYKIIQILICISIHAPTQGVTLSTSGLPTYRKDFNPHSHARSDERGIETNSVVWIFQSTLPRKERPASAFSFVSSVTFQSTLPRKERPDFDPPFLMFHVFQSTLPRKERQGSVTQFTGSIADFNPRSHARSDGL